MKKFPELNLPAVALRLRQDGDVTRVFDPLRAKWVVLTPEEWVRQHFTSWLRNDLKYPSALMANEVGIDLNGTRKRCDTVVFRPDGSPLVIVEYKAADVQISQAVFDQIVRYNMELHAQYLIVSNGLSHYCCKIDYARNDYHFIRQIPQYSSTLLGLSEN